MLSRDTRPVAIPGKSAAEANQSAVGAINRAATPGCIDRRGSLS